MSSFRHCLRRGRKNLIEKPFKSLKGLVCGQSLRFGTFALFFCLVAALLLWGCATPSRSLEDWSHPNGKLKVLSTTSMIDNVVGEIGGERVDHIPLIVGELDPHSYELVKGDDEKLSSAQLIFYNGLGLEHGASLRYHLEHHPVTVAVGNAVQERHPGRILRVGHDLDPHIWMDISLWAETVDPIVEALVRADPEGEVFYRQHGAELKERMLAEHASIRVAFAKVPEQKRYLVTSHDAFNYFARAYLAPLEEVENGSWKNRCRAPEGLAPDGQLSAADIQRIVDFLCVYRVQVVFPESNVSRDAIKRIVQVCKQKGIEVQISEAILYGDAMGNLESDASTYLGMMRHNASEMLKHWE